MPGKYYIETTYRCFKPKLANTSGQGTHRTFCSLSTNSEGGYRGHIPRHNLYIPTKKGTRPIRLNPLILLYLLVPLSSIPRDNKLFFESRASTSFTTPAHSYFLPQQLFSCQSVFKYHRGFPIFPLVGSIAERGLMRLGRMSNIYSSTARNNRIRTIR